MPITQDRLSDIISSARSCLTAYKGLDEKIKEVFQDVQEGRIDSIRALQDLYSATQYIRPTVQAIETLATEEQHLKFTRHRNVRNKIKATQKRREAGIQPRHQAALTEAQVQRDLARSFSPVETPIAPDTDRLLDKVRTDLEGEGPVRVITPSGPITLAEANKGEKTITFGDKTVEMEHDPQAAPQKVGKLT